MGTPRQPTVAGRGLGSELRVLRKARNLPMAAVADRLGWVTSKISRMETGKQGITPTDVASLLVVYEVTGDDRNRLLAMAERTDDSGWWEVIGGLSKESRTLIQFESEATSIVNFEPLLIPGLLQTAEYTRALMKAGGLAESEAEPRVAARMGRQVLLSRDTPPVFHAIVDEPALRRAVGGPAVMGRQLRCLSEATENMSVTLQVLPFALGGHTGLDGSFVLFDFPHNKPVVYLDHKISGLFLEEAEQIDFFRRQTDILIAGALSPARSRDLIVRAAREHEGA